MASCTQHLLGECGRDLALIGAAALEQGGQTCFGRRREQPIAAEQQMQRAQDRTARHLGHGLDGEGEIAGILPARRVHEPNVRTIHEQPDGHLGFPQQALEAAARGGRPLRIGAAVHSIEVGFERQDLHQQQPRVIRVPGLGLSEGEGRRERLSEFGQRNGQQLGQRPGVVEPAQAVIRPFKELAHERREVVYGERLLPVVRARLGDQGKEALLQRCQSPLVENRLSIDQRRRGDHQAIRLEVAEPSLMVAQSRIARHGYPVTGQR
jgi:hypothetical protein